VYEQIAQQLYEPQVQQLHETPQQIIENVVQLPQPSKCTCAQQAPEAEASYGIKSAQLSSEKNTQFISPASNINLFLPQAFRSRRFSSLPNEQLVSNTGLRTTFSVIDQNQSTNSQLNSKPIAGESIDKV
jgi:hypothetical protein